MNQPALVPVIKICATKAALHEVKFHSPPWEF